jgi:PKD repeat protein
MFFAAKAGIVSPDAAKNTAINFYNANTAKKAASVLLTYTESSLSGSAVYYVFNINANDGFVIVSAENSCRPIIGYSDRGHYDHSNLPPQFAGWMRNYVKQIEFTRSHTLPALSSITDEWSAYSGKPSKLHRAMAKSAVPPLTNIIWSQGYPFNAMCPGGSVTGCCATSMAQVMQYWKYPLHGLLSNTYNENLPQYQENYGVISRDFYKDTLKWAAMPDTISGSNPAAALLSYDCGVSIDMNYSPGGSNAQVVCPNAFSNGGADSASCQTSYVKFFGYNRHTIHGYYKNQFSDSVWTAMLENELNQGRIIQYTGGGDIGHAWVCEGYDTNNYFYMNWGWGGSPNGYFSLSALNPYSFNFDSLQQALIGIEPPAASAQFYTDNVSVVEGSTVTFKDESLTPTHITSWNWSFPGGTPSTSSAQNPVITYKTPGVYSVTLIVTAVGGGDTMTRTNYIVVQSTSNPLPLFQGFESPGFPASGWYLNNPNNWNTSTYAYGNTWQQYTHPNGGGYGLSNGCMMFYNFNKNNQGYKTNEPPPPNPIGGEYQQIYTPAYNFSHEVSDSLYFDVAYAPFNSQYSDTLAVYYSLDGGTTWKNIYLKGGMALATGDSISANVNDTLGFIPTSTQWRTDYIKLPSAVYGQQAVMFSFENRSYWGGQLYIDNINIPGSPLGLAPLANTSEDVKLYPNPNAGNFTLEVRNGASEQKLNIYDVTGKSVYQSEIPAGNAVSFIPVTMPGQSAGVYFYRITDLNGNKRAEGKFILQ